MKFRQRIIRMRSRCLHQQFSFTFIQPDAETPVAEIRLDSPELELDQVRIAFRANQNHISRFQLHDERAEERRQAHLEAGWIEEDSCDLYGPTWGEHPIEHGRRVP
jgi:hypothetical protein